MKTIIKQLSLLPLISLIVPANSLEKRWFALCGLSTGVEMFSYYFSHKNNQNKKALKKLEHKLIINSFEKALLDEKVHNLEQNNLSFTEADAIETKKIVGKKLMLRDKLYKNKKRKWWHLW